MLRSKGQCRAPSTAGWETTCKTPNNCYHFWKRHTHTARDLVDIPRVKGAKCIMGRAHIIIIFSSNGLGPDRLLLTRRVLLNSHHHHSSRAGNSVVKDAATVWANHMSWPEFISLIQGEGEITWINRPIGDKNNRKLWTKIPIEFRSQFQIFVSLGKRSYYVWKGSWLWQQMKLVASLLERLLVLIRTVNQLPPM